VGLMGGNSLKVIGSKNWKIQKSIPVVQNPRHITADTTGRLFVSFNTLSQIACIDPVTGQTLFKASTAANPRTIVLSKDQKYLFVTCYGADRVQVFRINRNSFSLEYSLVCKGKPIGIDLYEDEGRLEAWVATYEVDRLKIFTFKKNGIKG
jgi:DNA-binding beta-propeller fold protein YncE